MSRLLCISARFLDRRFHGRGDGDVPEWPPSPLRLFQALVRASHTGPRTLRWNTVDSECDLRSAFLWLERLDPPGIIAPAAKPSDGYVFFPPRNDADDPQTWDRQDRLSRVTHRPLVFDRLGDRSGTGDSVHYLWSIQDREWERAHRQIGILLEEARHITALGWGIDQVVANAAMLTEAESAKLTGQRWAAHPGDPSADGQLRIPVVGTLNDLERVHRQLTSRARVRMPLVELDRVRYVRAGQSPARPYAAFELDEDATPFRQEVTVHAASMLRSLVCRLPNRRDFSDQFRDDPEVYLAGHTGKTRHTLPRFTYLPLPTIGHRHADGQIRRFLIAEPPGTEGSRALWAARRLTGQVLVDADGRDRGQLQALWRRSSRGMLQRYVGEHRLWSTVTPVLLPGFDDGKRHRAEKLFLNSLKQAGVPVDGISDISMQKAPFWSGSSHPGNYALSQHLRGLPGWHVALSFEGPAKGPLAVGAGRYAGLGLMAGID